ncbi:hypothetical protein DFH27DRAFT_605552 [Peziza echinospora]|nr:hypothetical protein DFH27DRAFT_605552 [Peziza echinospora]
MSCSHHQQHHHQSQCDNALDILTSNILRQTATHATRAASVAALREKGIKCCCEQDYCAFFLESKALLEELEGDVQTAASLGQALLERHEISLQEAASERGRLQGTIELLERRTVTLETENGELERENGRTIEENRRLLAQLEDLNNGVAVNEGKVRELQGDLDAVHTELTRVAHAAARTEILEAQLLALESEQTELRRNYIRTKEDERAAVARWRQAERQIQELSLEVERIEREHRMEKARAQNLVDRLEKRNIGGGSHGGLHGGRDFPSALQERTAMSHFMRDILAENNQLQAGLVELRDMLLTSQEEVVVLREQLLQFSRAEGGAGGGGAAGARDVPVPLSRELLPSEMEAAAAARSPLGLAIGGMTPVAPELHFHHHIHKEKPVIRRAKRRGVRTSYTPDFSRRSVDGGSTQGVTTPTTRPPHHRWSQYSQASSGRAAGSFPGSPTSISTYNRDSSIFDRSFEGESTRPSTADTELWDSPSAVGGRFGHHHGRSKRSPRDSTGGPPFSILYTEEILENLREDEDDCDEEEEEGYEEEEEESRMQQQQGGGEHHQEENTTTIATTPIIRAPSPSSRSIRLRKSASHESLLVASSSMYPLSPSMNNKMTSFSPTSPAAIASAAASKTHAGAASRSSSGSHNNQASSSAAYNHLLLAGGSIRGRGGGLPQQDGPGGKAGWFGRWGTGWAAGFRVPGVGVLTPQQYSTSEEEEGDSTTTTNTTTTSATMTPVSSVASRSPAVSIRSLGGFVRKGKMVAVPAVPPAMSGGGGSSVATNSGSTSTSFIGKNGFLSAGKGETLTPLAVYKSMVDEQLLKESLMESLQM